MSFVIQNECSSTTPEFILQVGGLSPERPNVKVETFRLTFRFPRGEDVAEVGIQTTKADDLINHS